MGDPSTPPDGHDWAVDFLGFNPLGGPPQAAAASEPSEPAGGAPAGATPVGATPVSATSGGATPGNDGPTIEQMTGQAPILPADGASLIRSAPDGLLKRSVDGQEYWAPAPIVTMGGMAPIAVSAGWVTDYFTYYDLGAPADGAGQDACHFNGADAKLADVVVTLGEQAVLAGFVADAGLAKQIGATILAHRSASQQAGEAMSQSTAPATAGPAPNQGPQIVGAVGGQVSGHWRLDRALKPADTPTDGTVQFQFGLNDVQHPENMTGKEFQPQLTVQYNAVSKQWSVLAGGQAAYVAAVWGRVQLQFVGSLGAGIADKLSGGGKANGVFTVQIGPQLTVTVGPLQISLQPSASTTITSGPPTLDGNLGLQFALTKDLKDKKEDPNKDDLDISALKAPGLPMADMLDMLDVVQAKGKMKNVPAGQGDRVDTAWATVDRAWAKSEDETKSFYDRVGKLSSSDDQDAIRAYIYRHI